ncbi:MAG: hypothetical protein IPI73_05760 [Betaproteobacteria bacterium]|nr:hypothetical protein [Betaproteobacteria bacterium]
MPRTLKARSRPGDTTLQRHASFFDDNGDRGIDVAECTRGLKALGMPLRHRRGRRARHRRAP